MGNYNNSNKLRVFTGFAGYDSQCMALDRLRDNFGTDEFDYELVGWSEIEKNAIKAHNAVYPDAVDKNYGDISKIDWEKTPDFDLFTYSFPCFPAGVMIETEHGQVPIEKIDIGDNVYTHDVVYKKPDEMDKALRPVIKLYKSLYDGMLYTIETEKGYKVTCTADHPFLTGYNTIIRYNEKPIWTAAKDLTCDNSVYHFFSDTKMWDMERIQRISMERVDSLIVYNFGVKFDESYIADGFVVHNCTDLSLAGKQAGFE